MATDQPRLRDYDMKIKDFEDKKSFPSLKKPIKVVTA
jgi:hypothetical protein